MAPKSERKITSPPISEEERRELTQEFVDLAQTLLQQEDISNAENLVDIQRHIGLIAMIGGLSHGERARQVAHGRKMLAHEYVALPKQEQKVKGRDRLLRAARDAAGPEIAEVRRFKADVDNMPKAFKLALEDQESFHEELTTDPMILRLRESIREATQRRKR
jgi:hypothetical protein